MQCKTLQWSTYNDTRLGSVDYHQATDELESSILSTSAKRFTRGRSKTIKYSKMHKQIKELQNLYSWNQFYQQRNMKPEMKKAQHQITTKKKDINDLKNKKK